MTMAVSILYEMRLIPPSLCVKMIMEVTIKGREPPAARGVTCPYME